MRPLALPLVLTLGLTGCVIGGDKYQRPRDLPDSYVVDKPRVLAIQAEPPEVRPGESVAFTGLIADPFDELGAAVWIACLDGGGFGCPVDLAGLGDEPTPDELRDAGVIGYEPGIPPVWDVPADALDGLSDEAKLEGLSATVQVAAFPTGGDSAGIDFNDVEVAYKRLVVSEALTPNQNPSLHEWRVDGVIVPDGAVVTLDAGQAYDLSAKLTDGSVEDYVYVNSDGVAEDRTEEPFLTWYATTGDYSSNLSVPFDDYYAPPAVTWRAPSDPGEGRWYVVVRDRRGGQAWLIQDYVVQ